VEQKALPNKARLTLYRVAQTADRASGDEVLIGQHGTIKRVIAGDNNQRNHHEL
jgi:hypothetical protein